MGVIFMSKDMDIILGMIVLQFVVCKCPSVDIGNSLHVYAEFAKVESTKVLLPPTFYCRYCAFAEQVEFMVPFP